MPDVLRYFTAERRFEFQHRDWLIRDQEHRLLLKLNETPGKYVTAAECRPAVWPAEFPDWWRNRLTDIARRLATAMLNTSARIEPAAHGWGPGHGGGVKVGSSYHAGYRILGQLEVIVPPNTCPTCHQPMP